MKTVRGGRGFSLIELMVVVGILSLLAGSALMAAAPARAMALDAAASELVQAMHFARGEAMRTSMPRVVALDAANNTVRVYQLRYGLGLPSEDTANPVLHPLDKTRYNESLNGSPFLPISVTVNATFTFANGMNSPSLAFAKDGTPCFVLGPDANTVVPLSAGAGPQVTLSAGSTTRSVKVDPVTGRVTSQ